MIDLLTVLLVAFVIGMITMVIINPYFPKKRSMSQDEWFDVNESRLDHLYRTEYPDEPNEYTKLFSAIVDREYAEYCKECEK